MQTVGVMAKTPPLRPPKPASWHPRDLGATRFFARVLSFVAECPHCGYVVKVRRSNRTGSTPAAQWDPSTARWTCPRCEWVYSVGMLAWPAQRGAGAQALPDDQVPGPRQLAQLRTDGDGWWMPDALKAPGRLETSNLTAGPRPEPEDPLDLELALRPPDGLHHPWNPDEGDDDQ